MIYCGYAENHNSQGAFVIIFFICSDLPNFLRSVYIITIRTKKAKTSLESTIFAALMSFLYGHPRMFKLKYQQHGPFFKTIFPFVMTRGLIRRFFPLKKGLDSIIMLQNMLYTDLIASIIWVLSNKRMDIEVKPVITLIMLPFFICSPRRVG